MQIQSYERIAIKDCSTALQVVLVHLGAVVKSVQSITKEPAEALVFKVPEPITVQEYFARKGRK